MPDQRTSSIPSVKAKLVNSSNTGLFQTTLATAGVNPNAGGQIQVVYGGAGTSYERECVVVGDTRDFPGDQEWASLGIEDREEEYAIDFVVMADRDTQQEATERAFTIFGLLEVALRTPANINLGLEQFIHLDVQLAQPRHVEEPGQNSFLARVLSALRVKARI